MAHKAVLVQIIAKNTMHPLTGQHFTLPQALARAKTKVRKGGRFVTHRPGNRILNAHALRKYVKSRGGQTAIMKTKLIQHSRAYDSVLRSVAMVEKDFAGMNFAGNPQQVHSQFTKTFSSVLPTLVRTSSAFNLLSTQATTGVRASGSLKGAWFEDWCRFHLLPGKGRVRFVKRGSMSKARSSDAFDSSTGTLWDMKNYSGAMARGTSDNQADDYLEIKTKGYLSQQNSTAVQVNYLFPTLAAAKANQWLSTSHGFGVYYPKTGPNPSLVRVY